MGVDALGDARPLRRFPARFPNDFRGDRFVGAPTVLGAGEQVSLGPREDRIHNEAIVDAYGPEEQAMSWYYYLENKICFPFQAKCIVAKLDSPLKKGETVEVRRLAPEDAC